VIELGWVYILILDILKISGVKTGMLIRKGGMKNQFESL
jgi:hypothetical protein